MKQAASGGNAERPYNHWRGLIQAVLIMCATVIGLATWGTVTCARGLRLSRELQQPTTVYWAILAVLWLTTLGTFAITAWVKKKADLFDLDPEHAVSQREMQAARWFLRYIVRFDPANVGGATEDDHKTDDKRKG